ncbi:MAG TPA: hypothetical protein DCY64_21605 [Hydrogenophaga sp.]|nr:MAG: hypothetical protein CVU21_04300 [Betaproteobacteria bacterium HGW-Betaproteobacteria-15]HAX22868.1 hypothetical protein [Hydrogenophaga sp.]HBU20917.1 hypothetical protein [Hydrogenophaga sp.]
MKTTRTATKRCAAASTSRSTASRPGCAIRGNPPRAIGTPRAACGVTPKGATPAAWQNQFRGVLGWHCFVSGASSPCDSAVTRSNLK